MALMNKGIKKLIKLKRLHQIKKINHSIKIKTVIHSIYKKSLNL